MLLLLVGACVTYFSGNKWASKIALVTSIAGFVYSVLLTRNYLNGIDVSFLYQWIKKPVVHIGLNADGLGLLMVLLTTTLTPLIILSSSDKNIKNPKAFYALILFMAFAMIGAFLSADGLVYYIFWELSLIPIYFIALLWGNGDLEARKKAVVKFFIYTIAGSLFMLVAFVYLYQKAGSFLLFDLYNLELSKTEETLVFFAFFLAYAIKIPLLPFHTWQATVYQKAPMAGTMLLSGIMLKMGLYSIVRWQLPIAPNAAKNYMWIVIALCVAGVIYGGIVALRQKNIKRLLAYSSLSHVGLIAAGLYTLSLDGLRGAFLQMIAHGFVVIGLFFVAEIIFKRYQTNTIANLGGIRENAPRFTSFFLLLLFASIALPTTFNFIGEFTILYSLVHVNLWFAIWAGLTIVLGAYYMLRMFQHVMLGEKNEQLFKDLSSQETLVFLVIIVVIFFFGLYPKPIYDLITPTIEQVLAVINK